jgi:hypothetical protein
MEDLPEKGVARKLAIEIVEVGDKDKMRFRAADSDVEQFAAVFIWVFSLGEHPDVPLTHAVRDVNDHRDLLVALISVDRAGFHHSVQTPALQDTKKHILLGGKRRAYS